VRWRCGRRLRRPSLSGTFVARRLTAGMAIALLGAVVGFELVRQPSLSRLLLAACLGLCGVLLAIQQPRRAAIAVLCLLPFLALVRRLLLEFTPWRSTDPLLLVAPAVLGVVLVGRYVLERRQLPRDTISKLVAALVFLSLVEVWNPSGGGLAAGAAALLFTAVPLGWYFVGREFSTDRSVKALFIAVAVAGALVATYGLVQTWGGLPAWDRAWVNQTGYPALRVGKVVRAFGTFSSSAEYASFLSIGLVVSFAFALRGRPYLLGLVPLFAVALFYESGRGPLVATVLAALVLIAARTGSYRRALLTFSACLVAVAFTVVYEKGALQQAAVASSNPLVSHQLSGLSSPLNSKSSTLPLHLALVGTYFKAGLVSPAGHGIASMTLAGTQLGAGSTSSEFDLSNVLFGYGLLGGIVYATIVLLTLRLALRRAVASHDVVSLAALGVLVVAFGQWLNGGFYAVSPLVWFTVGFIVATGDPVRQSAGTLESGRL
jgi:hypothetical protein